LDCEGFLLPWPWHGSINGFMVTKGEKREVNSAGPLEKSPVQMQVS
jgi:hypothetical protein